MPAHTGTTEEYINNYRRHFWPRDKPTQQNLIRDVSAFMISDSTDRFISIQSNFAVHFIRFFFLSIFVAPDKSPRRQRHYESATETKNEQKSPPITYL